MCRILEGSFSQNENEREKRKEKTETIQWFFSIP
jgi:hypothetical protein